MKTRIRFAVPAEVVVEIEGDGTEEDFDRVYDEAVKKVTAALESFETGYGTDGVRLFASIDGVGADSVEAAE